LSEGNTQDLERELNLTNTALQSGDLVGNAIGRELFFVSRLIDVTYFPAWPEPTYVTTLPTVNISYKREVLEQVGRFDEKLIMGEDVDYNWRVQQTGYRIFYHPVILVRHHNLTSLWSFWQRYYTAGRYYCQVRRKRPDMYCVYPHGLHRTKDILKCIYFFVAVLYEPLVGASRMRRWTDWLLAVPVLIIAHISWKYGMVYQIFQKTDD
jgi:GT2 family glycosyltransferase